MNTQIVKTDSLNIRKPFDTLFPIGQETLDAIRQDMEMNGYDPVFPLVIWEETSVVVDGHTRFAAAGQIGIEEVPVIYKSFDNEDDAILYSFHIQRNRRNISDDDILKCLAVLDNIHGTKKQEKENVSRKEINEARAKTLGISPDKVDKARKVMEYADPQIKGQVESGEKTINKAFNEIQETRRESGEIKGPQTDGLKNATRYTQTLGSFLKELTRIREQGWKDVSREKALADIDAIRELVQE